MKDDIQQEIIRNFGNRLRIRVCGICIVQDRILLVKHAYLGEKAYLWAPPGGGIQFGEDAETALKREFSEETSFEVQIKRFLFVNEFLKAPLHAIELFFEVTIEEGKIQTGYDPEMPSERQIIRKVAFLSIPEVLKENPLNLHGVLRDIQNFSLLLEKKGYFLSVN